MKLNKIVSFILLFAIVSACQKDKSIPCDYSDFRLCNCQDFPETPNFLSFTESTTQYKSPCFNPNNSNEFIYQFWDNQNSIFQLIKYNLQTKEKTVIADGLKIYSQPKWSSSGWIAFDHFDNSYVDNIFIVKDNGDSLKQFTYNTANVFPVWNNSGDHLYWQYSPVLGVPYYFLKQNISQQTIPDTLLRNGDAYNGYAGRSDISINNDLVAHTYINNRNNIGFGNISSPMLNFTSIIDFMSVFDYPSPSGLCWNNDGTCIYSTHGGGQKRGLYSIDLDGDFKLLMNFCDTKRYTIISSSPDGKCLIGERIDSFLKKDSLGNFTGEVIQHSNIYTINVQTLEEQKIDLEE